MSKIRITKTTEPTTPPINKSYIYVDNVDNHLKQKDENGTIYDLTSGGGEITHGFSADNGAEVITAGIKGYFVMPYDYLITGWSAVGNKVGSCTIDIWKSHAAIPTVLDSITGVLKPALASEQFLTSSDLSSSLPEWETHINSGDIIAYNIDNVSLFNQLTFQLNVIRQ